MAKSPTHILTDPVHPEEIKRVVSVISSDEETLFTPTEDKPTHILRNERKSLTYELTVEEKPVYAVVGLFDDGQPAELFILAPTLDSDTQALLQAFCRSISIGLQHTTPLAAYTSEFREIDNAFFHEVFEWVGNRFGSSRTATLDSLSHPVQVESTT